MKFSAILISLLLFGNSALAQEVLDSNDKNNQTNSQETKAPEEISAYQYLHSMQKAYNGLNYELIYINTLQQPIEPKQLIHGLVKGKEISYVHYLNGLIRESVQFEDQISYFKQGKAAYTLNSKHEQSVFSNIANFDLIKGQEYFEYLITGKGRIAGRKVIAIRIISKDEQSYSYIVWIDIKTNLPLQLDITTKSNVIIDQNTVISFQITNKTSQWLEKLSDLKFPEPLNFPEVKDQRDPQWQLKWLPNGYKILKYDLHHLPTKDTAPVSYIMISNGLTSASIYVTSKKLPLKKKQQIFQQGATIVYTTQIKNVEVSVVGQIPVETAKRLASSIYKNEKRKLDDK